MAALPNGRWLARRRGLPSLWLIDSGRLERPSVIAVSRACHWWGPRVGPGRRCRRMGRRPLLVRGLAPVFRRRPVPLLRRSVVGGIGGSVMLFRKWRVPPLRRCVIGRIGGLVFRRWRLVSLDGVVGGVGHA